MSTPPAALPRLAVLVVMDGLRRDAVSAERTPNLWRLGRSGTVFAGYRSMFPSATRVVSSSTATGCVPASHGLAGNSMALLDGEGILHAHDAGAPGFLPARRALRGRALDRPTLADRLAGHGGAMIFSNVSPGAALAHDPDRSGHVVHRVLAHAPGREVAPMAEVTLDAAGDALLTRRFLDEVFAPAGPALGVLWLGEPDASQHAHPLGSPEAWAAIAAADARLGEVMHAVTRRREAGGEVLLLAGSDHGHETVSGVIDVEAELEAAGLRPGAGSGLVTASNGSAVLVHLAPGRDAAPVLDFLRGRDWVGRMIEGEALAGIGQRFGAEGLVAAISLRRDGGVNAFGVTGMTLVAKPAGGKPDRLGCGQHGGLGTAEQAPVMVAQGRGFVAGTVRAPASPIDLAPSVLAFLGIDDVGVPMDGRALQHHQVEGI